MKIRQAPPPINWTRMGTGDLRPFKHLSTDLAGPIFVNNNGKVEKRYFCIFVCSLTRAINIEIVHSQSAASFARAFRRHIADYGEPSTINSDRGGNFVKIREEMMAIVQKYYPNCTWQLNSPLSPRHGGHYEVFNRLLKRNMRLLKEEAGLHNDEELQTLAKEAKKYLNLRPLTATASDINDRPALCPADFLGIGTAEPQESFLDHQGEESHQSHLDALTSAIMDLRSSIYDEYVVALREVQARKDKTHQIVEGDLVMLLESGDIRRRIKLGVVHQVHPGGDDVIRVVDIRTVGPAPDFKVKLYQRSVDGFLVLRKTDTKDVERYLEDQEKDQEWLPAPTTELAKQWRPKEKPPDEEETPTETLQYHNDHDWRHAIEHGSLEEDAQPFGELQPEENLNQRGASFFEAQDVEPPPGERYPLRNRLR